MNALIFFGLLVAIAFVSIDLYESLQPQYRKGCHECEAARIRAEQVQEELRHDYGHRQGWGCTDKSCPRNRVD